MSKAAARAALDALPEMPGAAERRRVAFLDARVRDYRHQGVSVGSSPEILRRIDDAIARLAQKGMGNATSISLSDLDICAFAEVHAGWTYRDLRVGSGAASHVYARRQRETIRKRVAK